MGSYGPAFYQSYDGAGQFTYDFDGEQLFSVDLKREAVWRLPEFGNFAYFDPQNGLVSIRDDQSTSGGLGGALQ